MTALAITLTLDGIAAAINAANTGTGPLVISQIALLSGPTTEIKRITTLGGEAIADNIIHVTITDETADTYTLTGLRLITDGGIIFATYHQASPILEKGAEQLVLLSADILLTSVPPGSVTIGGTGFQYPPATTARQGVIEIATDAEAQTGTDTTRALTPAGLNAAAATTAPAMNGTAAVGTAKRWARADHVHPSDTSKANTSGTYAGLNVGNATNAGNADTVDGWHADSLRAWGNLTGKPSTLGGYGITDALPITGGTLTGDLTTYRAAAPGTGTVFFGNSGARYIHYDGTNFVMPGTNLFISGAQAVTSNGGTYSINITGSAGYASSAGNADTVDGWHRDDLRAWGSITGKPNTIAGYGITDALVYNNSSTYNINITGSSSYAPSAGSAGYATNAGNAATVTGLWASPGPSGARYLPGGDQEKWGTLYLGDIPGGILTYSVTFPLSFPNACDNIQLSFEDPVVNGVPVSYRIRSRNAYGFVIQIFENTAQTQDITIHWNAKGH